MTCILILFSIISSKLKLNSKNFAPVPCTFPNKSVAQNVIIFMKEIVSSRVFLCYIYAYLCYYFAYEYDF